MLCFPTSLSCFGYQRRQWCLHLQTFLALVLKLWRCEGRGSMADELDIEAMLEAPYRKVSEAVCLSVLGMLHTQPDSAAPPTSTSGWKPQPIGRHTFPICLKSILYYFEVRS